MADFVVPSILYLLFTLFSAVGAFLMTAHTRGRKAGLVAAVLTFLFFIALFAGLLALMPSGSLRSREGLSSSFPRHIDRRIEMTGAFPAFSPSGCPAG